MPPDTYMVCSGTDCVESAVGLPLLHRAIRGRSNLNQRHCSRYDMRHGLALRSLFSDESDTACGVGFPPRPTRGAGSTCQRLGHGMIGTVEMEFCGDPSMSLSLIAI